MGRRDRLIGCNEHESLLGMRRGTILGWAGLGWAATLLGVTGCDGTADPCLGTGALPSDSLEDFSAKCLDAIGLDVHGACCLRAAPTPKTRPPKGEEWAVRRAPLELVAKRG